MSFAVYWIVAIFLVLSCQSLKLTTPGKHGVVERKFDTHDLTTRISQTRQDDETLEVTDEWPLSVHYSGDGCDYETRRTMLGFSPHMCFPGAEGGQQYSCDSNGTWKIRLYDGDYTCSEENFSIEVSRPTPQGCVTNNVNFHQSDYCGSNIPKELLPGASFPILLTFHSDPQCSVASVYGHNYFPTGTCIPDYEEGTSEMFVGGESGITIQGFTTLDCSGAASQGFFPLSTCFPANPGYVLLANSGLFEEDFKLKLDGEEDFEVGKISSFKTTIKDKMNGNLKGKVVTFQAEGDIVFDRLKYSNCEERVIDTDYKCTFDEDTIKEIIKVDFEVRGAGRIKVVLKEADGTKIKKKYYNVEV